MLARVLTMADCPSVCLSVCLSQVETAERIELVFSMGASFHLSIVHCIVRKFSVFSIFAPNSGVKFRHSVSIVEACYPLCSTWIFVQLPPSS